MPRRRDRTVPLLALAAIAVAAAMAWPRATETHERAPATTATSAAAPPPQRPATGLDPGLAAALDAAIAAAADAGHRLSVTSGYRTIAEQEALLAEAIDEHGETEALRWVFPPERSMHVRGLAVDVGDEAAAAWLDDHGARLGLCRTLAWEWWHFEWRAAWEASRTCPRPAHDPADAPS